MKNRLIGLIPAAGEAGGFISEIPVGFHGLLGKNLLRPALDTLREVSPDFVIVVSRRRNAPTAAGAAGPGTVYVGQKTGGGSAAAVRAAWKELAAEVRGNVLIAPPDLPLIRGEVLKMLLARHRRQGNDCTVLSAEISGSAGFGRIIRGEGGGVRIGDEPPDFRTVHEFATGFYVFRIEALLRFLPRRPKSGSAGEADLPASIAACASAGGRVDVFPTPEPEDVLRIRTRFDLGRAADLLRIRKIRTLADAGVSILSPATTWIDREAAIGPDTVVYPGVVIEGPTVIGRNGRIHPGAHIVNSVIGDDVHVLGLTIIEDARIENDVRVGPFARIRMKTRLQPGSRVGNFVEMKNTDFGPDSKAMHLSYLGDAEVGEEANIGAGTITCNFDGLRKNRTWIGAGAFIGSGSELIAPVRIGRGAYIAAGSVITKDVGDDALAVARGRQIEKAGWAASRRAKIRASREGDASKTPK